MKNKIGIIFFLFAGILIAGLLYWDHLQNKKEQQVQSSENRLDEILLENIKRIEHRHEDVEVIAEKKQTESGDEEWFLISPVEDKADINTLKEVVDAFSQLKYDRIISDNDSKWKEYGLQPPTSVTTILTNDDQKYSFALGKKTVTQDAVYLADTVNKKTYLTNTLIISKVRKKLLNFRDKNVFNFDTLKVEELSYKSSAPEFIVFKKDNDNFELKSSNLQNPPKIDSSKVFDFITDLSLFKVRSISSKDAIKFSRNLKRSKAWYQIDVLLENQQKISRKFFITSREPWVEMGPKKYGLLEDKDKTKLRKSIEDFASRKLFDFLPEDIESITLNQRKIDITPEVQPSIIDFIELEFESVVKSIKKIAEKKPKHQIDLELKDEEKVQVSLWEVSSTNIILKHSLSKDFYQMPVAALDVFKGFQNPLMKKSADEKK